MADTIGAVVLDIEGTTTPISFVHDTLFPYVTAHVAAYLADHWDDDAVRTAVAHINEQVRTTGAQPPPMPASAGPRRADVGGALERAHDAHA